ncbi:MAG: DMT family transporter [Alphaproteobacteria bacterium]
MSQHPQGHEKAIALTVFAFMAFAVSDGVRKIVVQDYQIVDILFWQAISGLIVLLVIMPFIGGTRALIDPPNIKYQALRGVLIAMNTTSSLIAVSAVPIMDAYTIFFLTPFVTCVMGAVLFKEYIGRFRLISIAAGFIGALIAFRPGFEVLHPAYGYALACVFIFSASSMCARKIGRTDNLLAFAFWPFVILAIALLIYRGGELPPIYGVEFFAWMVLIGLAYGLASLTIAYAFTLAPAPVIAPYQYVQIIFALGFGYFVFGHVPDGYKITGALIIIGAGLVLFARERFLKQKAR